MPDTLRKNTASVILQNVNYVKSRCSEYLKDRYDSHSKGRQRTGHLLEAKYAQISDSLASLHVLIMADLGTDDFQNSRCCTSIPAQNTIPIREGVGVIYDTHRLQSAG